MDTDEFIGCFPSEIGILEIHATKNGISAIKFRDFAPEKITENSHIRECVKQLQDYFNGSRKEFSLTLDLAPTSFQQEIWDMLSKIPYGRTTTYSELAIQSGSLLKSRAVGMACAGNPVPIIIPCHRAIGKTGRLVGFRGELWRKKWLLEHEQKHSGDYQAELFEIVPEKIGSVSHPVVLYDGFCNLCSRSVQFILKRDKKKKFLFSPLSSEFSKQVFRHFNLPGGYNDSVILYNRNKVHTSSGAAIRIAIRLSGLWPLIGIFYIVPWFIRDFVYNFVARRRIKWFGKRDNCYLPDEFTQKRFIL
jgi:methylated-DNA-[protein]-cysteine S-methyltransferase